MPAKAHLGASKWLVTAWKSIKDYQKRKVKIFWNPFFHGLTPHTFYIIISKRIELWSSAWSWFEAFFSRIMIVYLFLWLVILKLCYFSGFCRKRKNTRSGFQSSCIIDLISISAIALMLICIAHWNFASNQDQNQLCSSNRLEMTTEKWLEVKVNP